MSLIVLSSFFIYIFSLYFYIIFNILTYNFLHFLITLLLPDNIAPRGIAEQSSQPLSGETAPEMAIDESPGSRGQKNTCASVPQQDNPWWRVDLRYIYRITAIAIFSVGDCCLEELDGAEVRIGFRNDTNNQR